MPNLEKQLTINYQQAIVNNFSHEKLGHFYNIKLNLSEDKTETQAQAYLQQWTEELLEKILVNAGLPKPRILQNHESVLWLRPDEEKKTYLVEQLGEFFKFLELAPGKLRYRFVVIEDAHLIMSRELFQKLLKTLEEPPANTTFFLLNPRSFNFPETLESRAISFYLNFLTETDSQSENLGQGSQLNFAQKVEQLTRDYSWGNSLQAYSRGELTVSQMVEELEEASDAINQLQQILLQLCQFFPVPYQKMQDLLWLTQQIQDWTTFNNPRSATLVLLLRNYKLLEHSIGESKSF